ncbi:DUF3139 domain-containing protein [Paenibacillus polymyxa]|uniref:DUF3139 domain-containing protein n=1 Tax=Paenibacillus polymyxa TaxID=1406 RepID=UPI002AB46E8A|nr:DUF3139 domain-containing protein [Paenibacillus polymyxa]MDY8025405.1 DUF3139 domain-containing protein [Paenibacillus polymyxa]
MKKKKIGITLLILIIVVSGGLYLALQIKLNSLEQDLKSYLINEKGYSESDILSIKARLSSMPKYPVTVRFRDDPNTEYIFTDRDASEWTQLSPPER